MFLEQEVVSIVNNMYDTRMKAQALLEAGVCHIIGLPSEVQVYEGIQEIANAISVTPEVRTMHTNSEYFPFRAEFECGGIKFFQLGQTLEESLKGVGKRAESEV